MSVLFGGTVNNKLRRYTGIAKRRGETKRIEGERSRLAATAPAPEIDPLRMDRSADIA